MAIRRGMVWTIVFWACTPVGASWGADAVSYGVAEKPWPENLGNHRARVRVDVVTDAVRVRVPWRRRDANPQDKDIRVVSLATGNSVKNVVRIEVNGEFGELVFQPESGSGEYAIYYMPFNVRQGSGIDYGAYAPKRDTADDEWVRKIGLKDGPTSREASLKLPEARVLDLQARTSFDRLDPMEIVATGDEVGRLLARHTEAAYLCFPEDREHPIRMTDRLPLRWADRGPQTRLAGEAARNEVLAFQVGLFAARQPIDGLAAEFTDLRRLGQAETIPASACRCYNLGGIDWLGRPFRKPFSVAQGRVAVLWFSVDVPEKAVPGTYEGTLTLRPGNAPPTPIALSLKVGESFLADRGDSEPWRHSRLRWLDSTLALDDEPVAPYTPLRVEASSVHCLDRTLRFAANGLPEGISSRGRELLTGPVTFVVETDAGAITLTGGQAKVTTQTPGRVVWESTASQGSFTLVCKATMEFDGHIAFRAAIRAGLATSVKDIRLEIPFRREAVPFMMGMGRKGGYRPAEWKWKWDVKRHQDSVWLGGVDAGLQCKLKGSNYSRPFVNIYYHRKPLNMPPSWDNGGHGGCEIVEVGADRVLLRAYSGSRAMAAGQEQRFDFDLLITPFHPLNTVAQFRDRYYHSYGPIDKAAATGANVVNIHHATDINPYINYPFLTTDTLAGYVKAAHEKNLKLKIYYTVREISNHTAELWALRSLGNEVLADGAGGGYSWLQEHLGGRYIPAWYHRFSDRDVDAAIVTSGMSRWHNYYLEGLAWLCRNTAIDGLYIDDVAYDRDIMKRVRKVLDRQRPGSLIDLHSWNHFNDWAGFANCANLYIENMPYIDRIWFGEGFDYKESPDYWLVEISGICFGLMSEMLEGGGNAWRGMVYGMTSRLPWSGDPRPVWRVWDAFGMDRARMIGYWDGSCPVRTDHEDVLATAYLRPGKTLIAVASWAKEAVTCRLQCDFAALGLDPAKVGLHAPPIDTFQPESRFSPSDGIPVQPGRGWLLILGPQTP